MKFSFRLLGQRRRKRVRRVARNAWIDCQSDPAYAEKMAAMRIEDQFEGIVTSLLIDIAIKLAVELIRHWAAQLEDWPQAEFNPPSQFVAGEPGSSISPKTEG